MYHRSAPVNTTLKCKNLPDEQMVGLICKLNNSGQALFLRWPSVRCPIHVASFFSLSRRSAPSLLFFSSEAHRNTRQWLGVGGVLDFLATPMPGHWTNYFCILQVVFTLLCKSCLGLDLEAVIRVTSRPRPLVATLMPTIAPSGVSPARLATTPPAATRHLLVDPFKKKFSLKLRRLRFRDLSCNWQPLRSINASRSRDRLWVIRKNLALRLPRVNILKPKACLCKSLLELGLKLWLVGFFMLRYTIFTKCDGWRHHIVFTHLSVNHDR